jgi:hypothetical protein
MTKKMMQKKSKTKAQAAKPKAKKSTAVGKKAVKAIKPVKAFKAVKVSRAVKAAIAANAVGAVKDLKVSKPSQQLVHAPSAAMTTAKQDAVAEVKPAVSGREAARLALVQKVASSKWASLYSKANKITANPYNLKNQYEVETAINHKTLGWGYIQDKKNDRLEVLFENGIKYLISNYK